MLHSGVHNGWVPENPYHTVPYITVPRFETHPDRLASVATLLGVEPAPVRACRVLEIGCGDGNNLIPMAYYLPESRFVGVDLADQAISAARRTIQELGLTNIQAIAADLRDIGASYGEFDYIIAHGLYSWVPAEVRDALMAVVGARLAPRGVAFISYNANPGGHVRQMIRKMMLYHTRRAADVHQRVEQGRWFLEWLGKSRTVRASWRDLLDEQIEELLERCDDGLAHDDLGECDDPFYLHEVTAHAAAHGMQYLGDAGNRQIADIHGALRWLEADAAERAQYFDFIQLRAFGETLLCRAEVPLTRELNAAVFERMSFSSSAHLADGEIEGLNHVRLSAGQPTFEPVALAMGRSYPLPVPFEDLVQYAENRDLLRNALAAMVFTSFAQYHIHDFACARTPSERPAASRLARYHASQSLRVPTVRHGLVELDEPGRQLLLLLDGTRNLDEISRDLARCPGAPSEEEIHRALPDSVDWMARMGLLEG